MNNQIQTNNVTSTEPWVELDEQQSSGISGGIRDINILNFDDNDVFDSNDNVYILPIFSKFL